ncbi:MAG: MASE1 domain-containing protein, partial [Burkholderiales bacterium]
MSDEAVQPPGARAAGTDVAPPSPARGVARAAVVATLIAGCAWLGLSIAFSGSNVSLFWLPSGIAVAALMLWGRWMLVPVALSVWVIEGLLGAPWTWAAPAMAAGCCAGYALAARLLRAGAIDPAFARIDDFRTLVRAALIGMLLPATTGVAALGLAGRVPVERLLESWAGWYAGDVLGVVLAVPLLLALNAACTGSTPPWRREVLFAPERGTERQAAAGVAVLVVAGVLLSLGAGSGEAPQGLVAL